MAKKRGTLASFGQVVGTNDNENGKNNNVATNVSNDTDNNNETNIDFDKVIKIANNTENSNKTGNDYKDKINDETTNKNNNKEVTNNMSILETITQKPKAPKKKQIAIYLDEDVAATLDHHAKKHGKGFKSELINELLKNELFKNK